METKTIPTQNGSNSEYDKSKIDPVECLTEEYFLRNIKAIEKLKISLIEELETAKSLPISKEVDLVVVKIQEGIMWLDMELKRLSESGVNFRF